MPQTISILIQVFYPVRDLWRLAITSTHPNIVEQQEKRRVKRASLASLTMLAIASCLSILIEHGRQKLHNRILFRHSNNTVIHAEPTRKAG